jgi:DNA (cytosine-5)-methyltransferase 1
MVNRASTSTAGHQEHVGQRRPLARALDLFCCAGGATRGLQQAGFRVTGVDIQPQPRYCGDEFHQGDALDFSIEGFDFIWASPPCQAFTALRFMPTAKEHPSLIPQTRAKLKAAGIPYCIENVEGAPLGDESGYLIMLCGTMFGLQTADGRAELRRHRLFELSFSIPLRPRCQHGVTALTVTGHTPVDNRHRHAICVTGTGMGPRVSKGRERSTITVTGNTAQVNLERNVLRETFTTQQAREAMGIDWMPMAKLSQAIPPAYARFIGSQALEYLALPAQAG